MRWACRIAAVVVVAMVLPCSASATTADDADKTLVELLSAMYQIPPPANVTIERVTMKVMLERYRSLKEQDCRSYYRDPRSQFEKCIMGRPGVEKLGVFVRGWFIPEGSSKNDLHLIIWQGAAVDTDVHEWLHWYYLNYRSPPVFGNHPNVYREADSIMANPRFLVWLMARESVAD